MVCATGKVESGFSPAFYPHQTIRTDAGSRYVPSPSSPGGPVCCFPGDTKNAFCLMSPRPTVSSSSFAFSALFFCSFPAGLISVSTLQTPAERDPSLPDHWGTKKSKFLLCSVPLGLDLGHEELPKCRAMPMAWSLMSPKKPGTPWAVPTARGEASA